MISKHLVFVYGTRPELIKLAPLILTSRRNSTFKVTVVSSGQQGKTLSALEKCFKIHPDFELSIERRQLSLVELAASMFPFFGRVLDDLAVDHPPIDAVVVHGDTTTALVAAQVAALDSIPVVHVEAGLRSFNRNSPFPEEINRRIIGVLATLHLAPTEIAAQNLWAERISRQSVHVTGNTIVDSLRMVDRDTNLPTNISRIVSAHRILLVTFHRRENWAHLTDFCHTLKNIADNNPDWRIVFVVHTNPKLEETVNAHLGGNKRIILLPPLPYHQFVALEKAASIIITDSGGIQEEAAILSKPVLCIRSVTERVEAVEAGFVRLVGLNSANIITAFHEAAARISPPADEHREVGFSEYSDCSPSQVSFKIIDRFIEQNQKSGMRDLNERLR
ncbi:UDP-N-acetylglucosamine 2-epimerase (non-hydrolyzing) [Corynebacterium sp. CCM 9185]|uniref:UDP-N-acetylglucosamine 2-epimerase (non-hydrolyzing) n=1 Tax=Corynebacterium marambiense TaxID=2765364 RepID=A0ABS0VY05_9CORY|nr:UDP-N-acetylglucosamine 2-epimerase (non-hydrolyzing) [Corynebacterium marambiense]MCK7663749.1 UDP-N-acetylglucosamine 2-epimerase (non-hydrolyzing) [Corynebacterium marambiense]